MDFLQKLHTKQLLAIFRLLRDPAIHNFYSDEHYSLVLTKQFFSRIGKSKKLRPLRSLYKTMRDEDSFTLGQLKTVLDSREHVDN